MNLRVWLLQKKLRVEAKENLQKSSTCTSEILFDKNGSSHIPSPRNEFYVVDCFVFDDKRSCCRMDLQCAKTSYH
jgi:hypothetical protein